MFVYRVLPRRRLEERCCPSGLSYHRRTNSRRLLFIVSPSMGDAAVRVLQHSYQLVISLHLALELILWAHLHLKRNVPSLVLVTSFGFHRALDVTTLEVEHGCGGGDRASNRRGGKQYCGGDCGVKISCPSRFASINICLVYFSVLRRGW